MDIYSLCRLSKKWLKRIKDKGMKRAQEGQDGITHN